MIEARYGNRNPVKMEVERYGVWSESTKTVSGDYLRVGGVDLDLRHIVDLEYARAAREHPENPGFHMRPMFYTGSPYGEEIMKLLRPYPTCRAPKTRYNPAHGCGTNSDNTH